MTTDGNHPWNSSESVVPPRPLPLVSGTAAFRATAAIVAALAASVTVGLNWPDAGVGHAVAAVPAALAAALVARYAAKDPARVLRRSVKGGLLCGGVPAALSLALAVFAIATAKPGEELTGWFVFVLLATSVIAVLTGVGVGLVIGLIGWSLVDAADDDAADAADVRIWRAGAWLAASGGLSAWVVAGGQGAKVSIAAGVFFAALGAAGALTVLARDRVRAALLRGVAAGVHPRFSLAGARAPGETDELPRYVAVERKACDAVLTLREEGTPFRVSARVEARAAIDLGARRALALLRSRSLVAMGVAVLGSGTADASIVRGAHRLPPPPPWEEPVHDAAWRGWHPHPIALPEVAVHVAIAENSACAALAGGTVACWGRNNGRFPGLPEELAEPTQLAAVRGARRIALGTKHACAIVAQGEVACWGKSWIGELGDGANVDRDEPVSAVGLSSVVGLALFSHRSCALTQSGAVWCWGQELGGVCGDAGCIGHTEPLEVTGLGRIEELGAGAVNLYARDADGRVVYVGANRILKPENAGGGDGPWPVGLPGPASRLATGTFGGCALLQGGGASCWGDTDWSESLTSQNVHSVDALRGAAGAAVGMGFTCALTSGGTVACWGDNRTGQLGDRTTRIRLAPARVDGVDEVVQVTADRGYACALRRDGAVWCWGDLRH